jgi:hypothetical protein
MTSETQQRISTPSRLLLFTLWILGIILAKELLSTLVAVIFPPWGWYLIIDHWLIPLIL